MPDHKPVPSDPWAYLRRHTTARIALGHVGSSLPTREILRFAEAHASARAAVNHPFDAAALAKTLEALGAPVLQLRSAAAHHVEFISRPDLGRRLAPESAERLAALDRPDGGYDLVLIVSNGLSALAVERQAPEVIARLLPLLDRDRFRLAPICVVEEGRVAIQDEIGSILRARFAVILIGERPGLGVPDSLGAYLVREPGPGKTDADRNCVSNIRPEGLPPPRAAERIACLLSDSRRLGISGTALKDRSRSLSP